MKNVLHSYSRFIASDTKTPTIRYDMVANDVDTLDYNSVYSYISALRKIFVIEDLPAWNPKHRSKTAIRTTDTRHFTDPSIATASMGIGPQYLLNDLQTMGLFFENLCIRDLRVFAEALDGNVYHYRDKTNLECNAVIHLRNGFFGLIEVTLGGSAIDTAAGNLPKLQERLDTHRMKLPSFLMVRTGTKDAYTRKYGVHVVLLAVWDCKDAFQCNGTLFSAHQPSSRRAGLSATQTIPRRSGYSLPHPLHTSLLQAS